MGLMDDTIKKISPVNEELKHKAQVYLDSLTKPLGSLGMLEDLAKQVIAITEKETVSLDNKVVFTFAADHGVVETGVSAFPQEVTAQMVYNFLNGGAGINVLARQAGARVVVADLGVKADFDAGCENLKIKKVNYGTKNMLNEPAMSREEAVKAIEAGIDIFNEELAKGIDLAGVGEMGIGNTTASSAVTAAITKAKVEIITGRGTGIDDKGLSQKCRIIEDALELRAPDCKDGIDVLSKVGGFEIGGLSGVILAAAAHRVPVLIDGFISGAAALIAYTIEPKVKDYMIAAHCSVEKGHRVILDYIGIRPLLDLNLRLGEGTGAALAMNIVEAAVRIYREMATFKDAGVSEQNE